MKIPRKPCFLRATINLSTNILCCFFQLTEASRSIYHASTCTSKLGIKRLPELFNRNWKQNVKATMTVSCISKPSSHKSKGRSCEVSDKSVKLTLTIISNNEIQLRRLEEIHSMLNQIGFIKSHRKGQFLEKWETCSNI